MKQKIFFVIRAATSLVLMTVLIYMGRDSIPRMIESVKNIPLDSVLLGFLMLMISIFIASLRLMILLVTQDIFISLAGLIKLTFVGYFFSSFLPTSVGGDVVKAFYISKASSKTIFSYTTVFIDRFIGMCAIFLLALCALFYSKEIPKSYINWLLPLLLAVSILFVILLFNKRFAKIFGSILKPFMPPEIRQRIKDIYDTLYGFKMFKFELFQCFVLSIVGQVIAFLAVYIFALGLKSYIPLKIVLLAMPVASIVSMLPSVNGVGPREMSIVILLSPFVGKDKALAIAFLWLALLLIMALIGGIIHMLTGHYKVSAKDLVQ